VNVGVRAGGWAQLGFSPQCGGWQAGPGDVQPGSPLGMGPGLLGSPRVETSQPLPAPVPVSEHPHSDWTTES